MVERIETPPRLKARITGALSPGGYCAALAQSRKSAHESPARRNPVTSAGGLAL
jgi:hypothetical protein